MLLASEFGTNVAFVYFPRISLIVINPTISSKSNQIVKCILVTDSKEEELHYYWQWVNVEFIDEYYRKRTYLFDSVEHSCLIQYYIAEIKRKSFRNSMSSIPLFVSGLF